jgi:hypothetical protein
VCLSLSFFFSLILLFFHQISSTPLFFSQNLIIFVLSHGLIPILTLCPFLLSCNWDSKEIFWKCGIIWIVVCVRVCVSVCVSCTCWINPLPLSYIPIPRIWDYKLYTCDSVSYSAYKHSQSTNTEMALLKLYCILHIIPWKL